MEGLAVARSLNGGRGVIGFVLVAVFAKIFRNRLLLRTVEVGTSVLDATPVSIAVVTLGRLAVRPASAPQPRRPPVC